MRTATLLILLLSLVGGVYYILSRDSGPDIDGLGGPVAELGSRDEDRGELRAIGQSGDRSHRSSAEATTLEEEPGPTAVLSEEPVATESNQLTGIVVDASGEPLAGCLVTFLERGTGVLAGDIGERLRPGSRPAMTTDASGRYRFKNLPPSEQHGLMVHHPEVALRVVERVLVGAFGVFEEPPIVLGSGKRLRGRVSNQLDQPIMGAELHLDSRWSREDQRPSVDRLSTTTDDEGNYELVGIPDGRRFLTVKAEGYGTLTRVQSLFFGDSTGDAHQVNFRMGPQVRLGGRIVDTLENPVPGAVIVAIDRGSFRDISNGRTESDPDGNFVIESVQQGTYQLLCSAPGFDSLASNDITTPVTDLEIVMEPLVTFSGVVVDAADGSPLNDFTVRLRAQGEDGWPSAPREPPQEVSGTTDGAFALTVDRPKGRFLVEARAMGYSPSYSAPIDNPGGLPIEGLRIEMGRGGTIRGRLVDTEGAPVIGGQIRSKDSDWSDDPLVTMMGEYYATNATELLVRSDVEGNFVLSNLRPASYQVLVQSARLHRQRLTDLVVEEQGDIDLGEIVMSEGGTLHGLLLDAEGAVIVGGSITLEAENYATTLPPRAVKSGADGSWRLINIVPGSYYLMGGAPVSVSVGPFAMPAGANVFMRVEVEAGVESRHDLQLENWVIPKPEPPKPPTGQLNGKLMSASGQGMEFAQLQLTPVLSATGPSHSCKTQREGSFAFLGVLPGEYELHAVGHEEIRLRVLIEADRWTNQNLVLQD
jgi:hypothetical protein